MSSQQPQIDFLILADAAQAVGGKLYLMGGGWDRLVVPTFGQPLSISLAAGIMVPWAMVGGDITATVKLEREDGTPVPQDLTITVNATMVAQSPVGRPLRVIVAGAGAWAIPGPGFYRLVMSAGGAAKATVFQVDRPTAAAWQA